MAVIAKGFVSLRALIAFADEWIYISNCFLYSSHPNIIRGKFMDVEQKATSFPF